MTLLESLAAVLNGLGSFWWIIVPVVLLWFFWQAWLYYIRNLYRQSIQWVLLNVRIPKEILKTPKAMEQVFAGAHGTYSFSLNIYDKYWHGKVELWSAFELMANSGGVYFFIRTPAEYRDMMESAIYAQYPDAEIELAEDYIDQFPSVLPDDTYDIFGTDLILEKEDAFPIRTYPYFESPEKEEKIDTMAALMEAMSHLKEKETAWLQVVVRPTGRKTSKWIEAAYKVRDKIIGRKPPAKLGFFGYIWMWLRNIILAPAKEPEWEDLKRPEEEKEKPSLLRLTKGEQERIRGIEEKVSKPAFETVIRFVFIDNAAKFNQAPSRSILATFRQFSDENLNSFRPNLNMMTITRGRLRWLLKSFRIYYKKRRIYDYYRSRWITKMPPSKFFIFNTEELATVYHFPAFGVEAPMLPRIETKKGSPPMTLPLEELYE